MGLASAGFLDPLWKVDVHPGTQERGLHQCVIIYLPIQLSDANPGTWCTDSDGLSLHILVFGVTDGFVTDLHWAWSYPAIIACPSFSSL